MGKQIGIFRGAILSVIAVAFVLSWSSGFLVAKIGASEAPVLTVLFWRFVVVGAILGAVIAAKAVWARLRDREAGGGRSDGGGAGAGGPIFPRWRDLRPHILIGVFAQFGYILPIYLAVAAGVSSGTTALIDAVQPLVVATLVGPLLGLRVRFLQWLGLVLGAIGVALVVSADIAATRPTWAYVLPLVSLASLVTATFLERRTAARLSVFATVVVHAAITLMLVAVLTVAAGQVAPPMTASFWLSTVTIAVLPTLIAYALYWYLLRRLGITVLNALLFLVAPATAVGGVLLFGEPFTVLTLAGLVLGGAAIALVMIADRRIAPPPVDRPSVADGAVESAEVSPGSADTVNRNGNDPVRTSEAAGTVVP